MEYDQPFQRVVIIGCGLIGGSLALSLKENHLTNTIVGIDQSKETLEKALRLGVIDEYSEFGNALQEADLIILATPVQETVRYLQLLAHENLKSGCIITDVSSTKHQICRMADDLLPKTVTFIGGHPMAGSERTGVEAAYSRLFENAVYVLTPGQSKDSMALERLQKMLLAIRAQVLILDPRQHDEIVAAISHLPHIIAAQLVDLVADLGQDNPLYSKLAAGGFRDVTRIASGSPIMWRDIVLTNSGLLKSLLDEWGLRVKTFVSWIEAGQSDMIQSFFERTRDWRDALPANAKGVSRNYYECIVAVEDRPGVIGDIASLLGMHQVNIRNIGILENREESNGQLLLSFATESDWESGRQLLLEHGYVIDIRE